MKTSPCVHFCFAGEPWHHNVDGDGDSAADGRRADAVHLRSHSTDGLAFSKFEFSKIIFFINVRDLHPIHPLLFRLVLSAGDTDDRVRHSDDDRCHMVTGQANILARQLLLQHRCHLSGPADRQCRVFQRDQRNLWVPCRPVDPPCPMSRGRRDGLVDL